jgi:hypothetical protein
VTAMKKPGRNDPCACGSGRKYKHCCLVKAEAAPHFTRADRLSAFAKLERFSEVHLGQEDDAAYDEFWGEHADRADELDESFDPMSTDAFDMWFWFDRPLADGQLLVDRVLAEDASITAGERRFLEAARETCMRLYEVADVRPGISIALRDVLDGAQVAVHEQSASRQLGRSDLLAVRVIRSGVSGQPEMEAGPLLMSRLQRQALVSQLASYRAEFDRENGGTGANAFYKETPPFFHSAWVSAILDPPIPRLANTDGDEMLITRAHFEVRDRERLLRALDASDELQREGSKTVWSWSGANREGKSVLFGQIELEGDLLKLETNSAARGARGRTLIETLAGNAVVHRATSHEDLSRTLREAIRSGRTDEVHARAAPAEIPAEAQEDLMLDYYARHYRQWLDDRIPALDGRTPREAAKDPVRRPKLRELLRGLEGMYQMALRSNEPAYDPSWMWAELGLQEESQAAHPPPLAHERWAEAIPGWTEVCRALVARVRALPGFDEAPSLISRQDLESDLVVRRFLQARRKQEDIEGGGGDASETDERLLQKLCCAINYELHRRKTFWVDESLAYMLAQTDLDVVGDELRVPFPSFALVFTDRQVLSLAERLIAADPACVLAGHLLRAATVYVTEENAEPDRVLHLGFALDALGADPPHLVLHEIRLKRDTLVEVHPRAPRPEVIVEGQDIVPSSRPLPGLLQVLLNAILYATSAGVEPQVRLSPRQPVQRDPAVQQVFSSEEVFFLPGMIRISKVRQFQELERIPSGRELLHRYMVRGHWRRPAKNWKEQRMRWIEPYWKGPDMAAIIERTYKLTP